MLVTVKLTLIIFERLYEFTKQVIYCSPIDL